MKKTAILLGATGLTGNHLLDILLKSRTYDKVKVFTRKPTGKKHEKLQEVICDLLHLEEQEDLFQADDVFCCIGTTKQKTPSKKKYKAIDYGIPLSAARLASKNGSKTFVVISALGADKNSLVFYNRTKGEMEESVFQFPIPNILIFRPSFIYGDRKDKRFAEESAVVLAKIVNPLLVGKLKKYRAIHARNLAGALYNSAQKIKGHHIIFRDRIRA